MKTIHFSYVPNLKISARAEPSGASVGDIFNALSGRKYDQGVWTFPITHLPDVLKKFPDVPEAIRQYRYTIQLNDRLEQFQVPLSEFRLEIADQFCQSLVDLGMTIKAEYRVIKGKRSEFGYAVLQDGSHLYNSDERHAINYLGAEIYQLVSEKPSRYIYQPPVAHRSTVEVEEIQSSKADRILWNSLQGAIKAEERKRLMLEHVRNR